MRRLRFLEGAQWWDRGRIDAWRNGALSGLVRVCYNETPFYRQLMDRAGVRPADIRTLADLARLPVVTKTMLRDAYPDVLVRETGLATYETRTSGSTGQLFSIREDAATAGSYRASFLLSLEWAGWSFGDRHMMSGVNFERSADRRIKDALLRCHYVRSDDLTDARLDEHLDLLERLHIEHLWGYPGLLSHLARRAEVRQWGRPMKSVVTWGEMLYASQREEIERAFRTQVFDTYGCGEGFQIAAQCGRQGHYHIHEFDVAVETLDDDGLPVAPGETGHITVTRFHPGPMPFLRYQPGDLAILSEEGACGCGRVWARLESIEGRATDTVVTPSGNRIVGHIFNRAIKAKEIDLFQVVQTELSSMTVRVLLMPGERFTPALERRLIDNLRRNGADLEIHIEPVSEMPVPPSGKHRFVVSEVGRR
jgi:phenylacetate-CoA ligase